jgi:hypothetical protein
MKPRYGAGSQLFDRIDFEMPSHGARRSVGWNFAATRAFVGPSPSGLAMEGSMRNMVSKAMVAGVAALALTASLVATTEPAAAQWHGGWHGGGWGGGWHGGGWGGGWHGGGVWHPGYWRSGVWYNGWWGPAAVAGAIAAGALAAGAVAAYPYGYPYGYPNGCIQTRPLYAPNGAWIGNGPVNVCQ